MKSYFSSSQNSLLAACLSMYWAHVVHILSLFFLWYRLLFICLIFCTHILHQDSSLLLRLKKLYASCPLWPKYLDITHFPMLFLPGVLYPMKWRHIQSTTAFKTALMTHLFKSYNCCKPSSMCVCVCDVDFVVWLSILWFACNYCCLFPPVMSNLNVELLFSVQCAKVQFNVKGLLFISISLLLLCVCVCVCVCAHMCVRMQVCVCTCACKWKFVLIVLWFLAL